MVECQLGRTMILVIDKKKKKRQEIAKLRVAIEQSPMHIHHGPTTVLP